MPLDEQHMPLGVGEVMQPRCMNAPIAERPHPRMPDFLQRIGLSLQQHCPPEAAGALLYAEVEDGVISCSVFFTASVASLGFRFASAPLEDLIYEFWETGQDAIPPRSWAAIEYQLMGHKLDVEFAYANQFKKNEGQHERRQRVLARRFPGFSVDYSNPGA